MAKFPGKERACFVTPMITKTFTGWVNLVAVTCISYEEHPFLNPFHKEWLTPIQGDRLAYTIIPTTTTTRHMETSPILAARRTKNKVDIALGHPAPWQGCKGPLPHLSDWDHLMSSKGVITLLPQLIITGWSSMTAVLRLKIKVATSASIYERDCFIPHSLKDPIVDVTVDNFIPFHFIVSFHPTSVTPHLNHIHPHLVTFSISLNYSTPSYLQNQLI